MSLSREKVRRESAANGVVRGHQRGAVTAAAVVTMLLTVEDSNRNYDDYARSIRKHYHRTIMCTEVASQSRVRILVFWRRLGDRNVYPVKSIA